MDFRELTYITAVADTHSVTEAARKLYISQPSLSYMIGKVEEDLGVKLFDRKTNPLSLTYAGEKYVQTAREILRMRDNMRREMNDIGHGDRGRIHIGIPNERAGYMLPRAIPIFRQKYPGVEIRLEESQSEELIRNLMIDKVGFCVMPIVPQDLPPGVCTEPIYPERLLLVAGEDMIPQDMIVSPAPSKSGGTGLNGKTERSNATEFPQVDLTKMKKTVPFIMQKSGKIIRRRTDDLFRTLGFFPKEVMEVSSSLTAVQLAEAGMGLTIVPERAILQLGGFARFHCYEYSAEPQRWEVCAVYKKDGYLDSAERALIDALKEAFGK